MFIVIRKITLAALVVVLLAGCGTNKPVSKTAQTARPTVPTTPQIIVGFGELATLTPTARPPTAALVPVLPREMVSVPLPTLGAAPRTTPFPSVVDPAIDPSALPLGPGCDNPLAQITYPRDGQAFTWGVTVPVTGTANVANFLFYKIQYMPEASYNDPLKHDAWGELYANEKDPRKMSGPPKPVVDGRLMEWQTKTITRGTWWMRLLATNTAGQYGDNPCTVKIVVR